MSAERPFTTPDIPVIPKLPPLELLRNGVETERLERIPIENVVAEWFVATEDKHVAELADSMRGKRGQISPITVRARDVGGTIHYDIIDGFHRTEALRRNGQEYVDAAVVYGCPDEELYDLRVLAANSVKSVQFQRIAYWMRGSYSLTQWYQRGYSLSQIFSLAMADTSGTRLGLAEQEAEEAKNWAREKARIWGRPVSTIYDQIKTVEIAAPDLVDSVRVGGGGKHSRRGELSPARLKAIVFPLAGEYDLQRQVTHVVLEENLVADDALVLAQAVAAAKSRAEITHILRNPQSVVDNRKGTYAPTQGKPANLVLETTSISSPNSGTTLPAPTYEPSGAHPDVSQPLPQGTGALESGYSTGFWWGELGYLSDTERRALYYCFGLKLKLAASAIRMNLSTDKFYELFVGTVTRVLEHSKPADS